MTLNQSPITRAALARAAATKAAAETRHRVSGFLRAADVYDADALFRVAILASKSGLDDAALALLERGRREHPGDARLWQMTGLCSRNLDDTQVAVSALAEAARLAPADPLIAHTLARATLEAGLPASALFARARLLAPRDGAVLLGEAAARFADGDSAGAMAGIDAELRQSPGWLEGHATLARLRWMVADRASFVSSYMRALNGTPRMPALWNALAQTLIEAEQFEAALTAIARSRGVIGRQAALDGLEAAAYAELGNFREADRLFALLPRPLPVSLATWEVRHLLRAGRPAEAARIAEARCGDEGGDGFWPYLSVGWRLLGDPRWAWLEGDARLIGIYDISDRIGSVEALAECLRKLHLASEAPLDQSLRGGTQTDGPLFARIEPAIRQLREAVVETVRDYVAQLPARDEVHPFLGTRRDPIRFAGSWSVRLTGEGRHVNHVHPAGWISSALYVALPDSLGGEGQAGWLTLGETSELGLDLPPFKTVEPKPGRLVLFPSTMWHGTRPFPMGERLTVAFDVARPQ